MNDWLSNVEKGNKKIRDHVRLHSETNSERMARVLRELAKYTEGLEEHVDNNTMMEEREFANLSDDAKELVK
ncbi:MAG: hypothetical protein E3J37_03400 [Anaerolineales bacterium]|nr:MAG: hypothetical protein E3J37_03400 [Anaerolineales bacterium]